VVYGEKETVQRRAQTTDTTAQAGAVTLIQLFGSALNLNVHFHMLFLDGVYVERPGGSLRLRWVRGPTSTELTRQTRGDSDKYRRNAGCDSGYLCDA
jgi:hypothetical protein